ncbi:hypothetical protein ABTN21_18895, partial [Acinetobacter baumannii]
MSNAERASTDIPAKDGIQSFLFQRSPSPLWGGIQGGGVHTERALTVMPAKAGIQPLMRLVEMIAMPASFRIVRFAVTCS